MDAVVFKKVRQVMVEKQPIPEILDSKDAIVRVIYSAICGSDLHPFRGVEPCKAGTIMGHELYGTIEKTGEGVRNLQIGDKVICPFTISCGECFYCQNGYSSRCTESQLFGGPNLQGTQAQYVRIPWAEGTLMKAMDDIDPKSLVLMGDVLPTGYFAAASALNLSTPSPSQVRTGNSSPPPPVVIVLGCGPVGICAMIAAASLLKPRHLFAIDSVPSRLELARSLGAEPLNLDLGTEQILNKVRSVTQGRGADIVLEIVGASSAIKLGFDVLRPFGTLVSVGVHSEDYPWNMDDAYSKNIRLQFGRCPVRSIFPSALEFLRENAAKFDLVAQSTIIMPLSEAVEAYELFDQRKVGKVLLRA